jgi:hypothetical protein
MNEVTIVLALLARWPDEQADHPAALMNEPSNLLVR